MVESRLQSFVRSIAAGFFFPGSLESSQLDKAGPSLSLRVEAVALASTAFDVLGGLLIDCRQNGVPLRSASLRLDGERVSLLRRTRRRPAAVARPPFRVRLPTDTDGNDTLLVEIQFERPAATRNRERLLDELALWEVLQLAYPTDPEEPIEHLGAQRLFNDPRTIHHTEWSWEADPLSWNLLVNLCCAWHRTGRVVCLHLE